MQICIWPSWWHCQSLSLASVKSRLVLPFWYRLTQVVLEKGPLNWCVCVNTINGPIVVDLLLVTVKIKHKDNSNISLSLIIFCYKHVLETTSAR